MKIAFQHIFPRSIWFDPKNAPNEVGNIRRIAPQFLCSCAQFLFSWNMGMVLAISSIVVPSVIGVSADLNPDEILHMTPNEASWLASILFMVQPIGCLLSGFITESMGRRKAILIVNTIPAVAWIILPNAKSREITYIGFCLLGIWNGLISSVTYISEISEPSIRGVLSAFSGISSTAGIFMIFSLGSFISWRQVAYVCSIIPILNIIVALFVTETPIWLLSKRHPEKAQRSLQVLRGWVSSESVSTEFEQLKYISKISTSCSECEKSGANCDHPSPTLLDKFKDMTKKRSLKPFTLVTILFLLMQFSGMFAMRPYIVPIVNAHGISFDANVLTIILGVIGIFANVFIVFTVRKLGKRKIYLYSMVGNFISSFGLSMYGWFFFPSGWSSIDTDIKNATHNVEVMRETVGNFSYFAIVMFMLMQFCVSVGVSSVPYILISEIFPFKSRSFYCGLAGAENQLFAFVATKTYYDLERWLSLPGVIAFYGAISVFGFVLMVFMLPETEHRSLKDIEMHFSDDSRSIFDININIIEEKK